MIEKIAQEIINVAVKEDDLLRKLASEGIYHMPELAFVYECGKSIMQYSNFIFGKNTPKWYRELDLGNGGPTDLVFEFEDGHKIAIEFKMNSKIQWRLADIDKLSKLDGKTVKIFCGLTQIFEKDLPGKGEPVDFENQTGHDVSLIKRHDIDKVKTGYKSDTTCLISIWSVGIVPEISA